jgi:hypothetical protein
VFNQWPNGIIAGINRRSSSPEYGMQTMASWNIDRVLMPLRLPLLVILIGPTIARADEPTVLHEAPITPADRQHWAFRPLTRCQPPEAKGECADPIDRFLLARLERDGLAPLPIADRRTLLRRITLDLTGLPPQPEQIAAFLTDDSPEAYEWVVDRLLASPAYGERWAQHWLDVAAREMAAFIVTHASLDPTAQINLLYERTLGRPPTEQELAAARMFLAASFGQQDTAVSDATPAALVELCLAILNLNEFIYVD